MNNILACRNLTKRYPGVLALDNISLEIPRGKIVGLLGPNGSGKTTLIKLAAGLLTPSAGEILIDGIRPGIETKKIVSYLPEHTYLNQWMRVFDILQYFSDFYENFNIVKAREMLKALDLHEDMRAEDHVQGDKRKGTADFGDVPGRGPLSPGRTHRGCGSGRQRLYSKYDTDKL